jgi:hypothetical protein
VRIGMLLKYACVQGCRYPQLVIAAGKIEPAWQSGKIGRRRTAGRCDTDYLWRADPL